MQLHRVVVVIATTFFVVGCGFVPKKPPMPNNNKRVPINMAAPDIRPWSKQMTSQVPALPTAAAIDDVPMVDSATIIQEASAVENIPEQTPPVHDDGTPTLLVAQVLKETEVFENPDLPLKSGVVHYKLNKDGLWEKQDDVATDFVTSDSKDFQASSTLEIDQSSPIATQAEALNVTPTTINDITPLTDDGNQDASQAITQTASASDLPLSSDVHRTETLTVTTVTAVDDDVVPDPAPEPETEPEQVPEVPLLTWSAQAGITLNDLLSDWGNKENWTVLWETPTKFRIEAPFSIEASSFLDAANQIFKLYSRAGYTFTAQAHTNQVLRVTGPKE